MKALDNNDAQNVMLRDMALRHAVKWVDWPGAKASTVTDAAVVFEEYLRTGDNWDTSEDMPDAERDVE